MTSTELEPYVDSELVPAVDETPLTERQAKALNKQIRDQRDKVLIDAEKLSEMVDRAARGQIHKALGLPSWDAWAKDALQFTFSDRFERKAMVELMSGKGMSQRRIGDLLGISQKTVDRDLEGVAESPDSATVIGADHKVHPKHKQPKAEEPLEAEEVPLTETPEELAQPTAAELAKELIDDFRSEMELLGNCVQAIGDFTNGQTYSIDIWERARKRVIRSHLNGVGDAIKALEEVRDKLMAQ